MAAKLTSYRDLKAERDQLSAQVTILSIAITDRPEATYRHRANGDSYSWRAYRLTGAAGGYVTCTFRAPSNRRPCTVFVGNLEDLIRWPHHASNDDGHVQAAQMFKEARYRRVREAVSA